MHADRPRRCIGFTVIDLMAVGVVLVVVVVLVLVAMPMFGGRRGGYSVQMMNNTQLRGIHQSFVTFAQSNKRGGNDGYFPGLDGSGDVIPDGPLTGHSGDGTVPAAAMWMMLEGNFFTPEYMVNPADAHAVELLIPATGPVPPVTHDNFSYALQSLAGHPAERGEWKEALNTAAPVAGDRAIGTGSADISSVWTARGSGDWRGGVVENDNSSSYGLDHVFTNTKYGHEPVNPTDDLFEDDPAAADAFLVHEDATTAYSAR